MSVAMFKLESFSSALAGQAAQPGFDKLALERAYADGLAEGLARQADEQIRALTAGLDRICAALNDDQDRRIQLRQEAVAALAPVLEQILDCLAPAAPSRRLEEALHQQLLRLSQDARPLSMHIACGPALREMVERCLAGLGLHEVELVATADDRISLALDGGRIELSPERTAAEIRALISEIKGDNTSWTD